MNLKMSAISLSCILQRSVFMECRTVNRMSGKNMYLYNDQTMSQYILIK